MPCQMCCGTMYMPPIRNRFAYSGWLKVSTAVVAFGAVALSGIGGGATGVSVALFFSMLKLKATSLAVSGLPSLNFTPWRIVNVSVLPPSDQAYLVASQGVGGCAGCMMLNISSGSYTSAVELFELPARSKQTG